MFKLMKAFQAANKAMEAGEELKNPEKWKKGQNLINSIAALLAAVLVIVQTWFPDIEIAEGMIMEASGIIGAILIFIANWFLTTATSKKIGKK